MAGNLNQYDQFKGFIAPHTPAPLAQMLEMAKANKAAEGEGFSGVDTIGVQDAVLPGMDTEQQRAFEQDLMAKATDLRERYMRKELDPNQFKFEINRLKTLKDNDLGLKSRRASYASAALANQTNAALAKEGKLAPQDMEHDYLRTEWDSQKGIFQPRPTPASGYDYDKEWEPAYQNIGNLRIEIDEQGREYTVTGIPPEILDNMEKTRAEAMYTTPAGIKELETRKAIRPDLYGKMTYPEMARAIQAEKRKDVERNSYSRIPSEGDNSSGGGGGGITTSKPANVEMTVPGNAVTIKPLDYQTTDGETDMYGDSGFDLATAPTAAKNSYNMIKNRLVYDKEKGTWKNKDGSLASNNDIQAMKEAENDYRLFANIQKDVYEQAFHEMKSNGIRLNTKRDEILNQDVLDSDGYGFTDIAADVNRRKIIQQKGTVAKALLNMLDKNGTVYTADLEALGLPQFAGQANGVIASELKGDLTKALKEIVSDPNNITKYRPDLSQGQFQIDNPSEIGKAFQTRTQFLMNQRYQALLDGEQVAGTSLFIPGEDRKAERDFIQKNVLDVNALAYDAYTDPKTGNKFFDAEGLTGDAFLDGKPKRNAVDYAKQFKGITVDPNTGRIVASVTFAPKGAKTDDEPLWEEGQEVFAELGSYSDDLLKSTFPGQDIYSIKDYAAQIQSNKSYSYKGKGPVELNDGTVVEIIAKPNDSEIQIKEYDPVTGKPTGEYKKYASIFEASAALEKQERGRADVTTMAPALDYVLAGIESSHGKNTKNGNAIGNYQIMWTDVGGKMAREFAKKMGYGDITEDDFRNSPEMQQEFIQKAWLPQLYKEATAPSTMKAAQEYNTWATKTGNPLIESTTELVGLTHFLGSGDLRKFLMQRKKFQVASQNESPFIYLQKLKAGIAEYEKPY